MKNLRNAKRSSGGKIDCIRLWQKAKTPRSDASDVQYSFILRGEEKTEEKGVNF